MLVAMQLTSDKVCDFKGERHDGRTLGTPPRPVAPVTTVFIILSMGLLGSPVCIARVFRSALPIQH